MVRRLETMYPPHTYQHRFSPAPPGTTKTQRVDAPVLGTRQQRRGLAGCRCVAGTAVVRAHIQHEKERFERGRLSAQKKGLRVLGSRKVMELFPGRTIQTDNLKQGT